MPSFLTVWLPVVRTASRSYRHSDEEGLTVFFRTNFLILKGKLASESPEMA